MKLYEGSAVTLGANSNTPFLGFKSELKQTNDLITKITGLIRNGDLTDDTFIQLELALKQLQSQSYELGKNQTQNTQEDLEPSADTQEKNFEPLINTINKLKFNI